MDELYHHGVKGMKWGIRRKKPSPNKSSNLSKSSKSSDVKNSIERGRQKAKRFLQQNGGTIVKTGAIIGLSAIGIPYAAVILSNIGNLDMSGIIDHNKTTERVYSNVNGVETGDRSYANREKVY